MNYCSNKSLLYYLPNAPASSPESLSEAMSYLFSWNAGFDSCCFRREGRPPFVTISSLPLKCSYVLSISHPCLIWIITKDAPRVAMGLARPVSSGKASQHRFQFLGETWPPQLQPAPTLTRTANHEDEQRQQPRPHRCLLLGGVSLQGETPRVRGTETSQPPWAQIRGPRPARNPPGDYQAGEGLRSKGTSNGEEASQGGWAALRQAPPAPLLSPWPKGTGGTGPPSCGLLRERERADAPRDAGERQGCDGPLPRSWPRCRVAWCFCCASRWPSGSAVSPPSCLRLPSPPPPPLPSGTRRATPLSGCGSSAPGIAGEPSASPLGLFPAKPPRKQQLPFTQIPPSGSALLSGGEADGRAPEARLSSSLRCSHFRMKSVVVGTPSLYRHCPMGAELTWGACGEAFSWPCDPRPSPILPFSLLHVTRKKLRYWAGDGGQSKRVQFSAVTRCAPPGRTSAASG